MVRTCYNQDTQRHVPVLNTSSSHSFPLQITRRVAGPHSAAPLYCEFPPFNWTSVPGWERAQLLTVQSAKLSLYHPWFNAISCIIWF